MNDKSKLVYEAAKQGATVSIQTWIAQAGIQEGSIESIALITSPGSFRSEAGSTAMRKQMSGTIMERGITGAAAEAFTAGLWDAWEKWAGAYVLCVPCYEAFAVWPGSYAPPTPNTPFPIACGFSYEENQLRADKLSSSIRKKLSEKKSSDAEKAVLPFVEWFSVNFESWKWTALFCNILACGTVPMFAPPYIPVGPVIGGHIVSPGVIIGSTFGFASVIQLNWPSNWPPAVIPSGLGSLPLPTPNLPTPNLPTPNLPTPNLPTPNLPTPNLPTPNLPTPNLPTPNLPTPNLPTPNLPTPNLPKPKFP